MKKIYLTLLSCFIAIITMAQTPGFSYQAVILNPDAQSLPGNDVDSGLLSQSEIMLRFTIENYNGTEYQETHIAKTDAYGMVHLMVGQGNATVGSFTNVVWDGTERYLQVEIDFTASGANYEALDRQALTYSPHPMTNEELVRVEGIEFNIESNSNAIITNATNLATANANISTNTSDIAINASDIATANTGISTNTAAITANTLTGTTNANDIAAHIAADLDTDNTNEIQDLQLSGNDLSISNGSAISLAAYLDNTDTQLDSSAVAALGFVAGAHTIDTYLDSTAISGMGYAAGVFELNTNGTGIQSSKIFIYNGDTSQVTASGYYSTAMGVKTKASGYISTAMGAFTIASAHYSTAMGQSTEASAYYATAMGYNTKASGFMSTATGQETEASGYTSTAIGCFTEASGDYSTAMGYQNTASGDYSTAMGYNTRASGLMSTATGYQNTASGDHSTAMGYQNTASGLYSTAMGANTIASGDYSTAMGANTIASGDYSTAMGQNTEAHAYQLVIGRNNIVQGDLTNWVSTDAAFIIGNGVNSPSNSLMATKYGDLFITGILFSSSDIRLKTNITPVGNVLSALEFITPITYEFKDTETHPAGLQIGFSAQEIQAQFPELVRENAKGELTVAYGQMSAVLLQAIKEMKEDYQSQIDDLQKEIILLKNK